MRLPPFGGPLHFSVPPTRTSGEDLGLGPVELGLSNRSLGPEVSQLGQLIGGAHMCRARLDPRSQRLVLRLADSHVPLVHRAAPSDHIHEYAEERENEDEEQPARFAQPTESVAPKDVPDHPEEDHEPKEEDEKIEDGPKRVEKWIGRSEHLLPPLLDDYSAAAPFEVRSARLVEFRSPRNSGSRDKSTIE